MFTRAIVRPPAKNFADGLTTVDLGVPDFKKALQQHSDYCQALGRIGLKLIRLPADLRYPDSTFVEDTAILTDRGAILTHPGAPSREGEVVSLQETLGNFYPSLPTITSPGTLDGGDICEAGDHFFIGLSHRTNEAGAQQLANILASLGYTSSTVDIRNVPGLLHLKSGLAYLGDNRLVLIDSLVDRSDFHGYTIVHVVPAENYAANCVRVNDFVLIADGYPLLEKTLNDLGCKTIALNMSEYQKMDGGLSCLSLRF
ncbi:MAG TPA: arginine deiminase family protein [Anaerolineae bacterium]|nr:arginine deiminase family protein [Anaerolineae bacterium]